MKEMEARLVLQVRVSKMLGMASFSQSLPWPELALSSLLFSA